MKIIFLLLLVGLVKVNSYERNIRKLEKPSHDAGLNNTDIEMHATVTTQSVRYLSIHTGKSPFTQDNEYNITGNSSQWAKIINNVCKDNEKTLYSTNYLCPFLIQTEQYETHGYVEDESIHDVISQVDKCLGEGRRDDCTTQTFCSCIDCSVHDDCCYGANVKSADSKRIESVKTRYLHSTCQDLNGMGGWLMVSSCPPSWTESEIKEKCELTNSSDIISMVPVYDEDLKVSYKNIYCADCHGDGFKVKPWDVYLRKCSAFIRKTWIANVDQVELINNLLRDRQCRVSVKPFPHSKVMACLNRYNDDYTCSNHNASAFILKLIGEENLEEAYSAKNDTYFSELMSVSHEPEINSIIHKYLNYWCRKYKNVVLEAGGYAYRNGVCRWCTEERTICPARLTPTESPNLFALRMNFNALIIQERFRGVCNAREIFDELTNHCRPLMCPGKLVASQGKCAKAYVSITGYWFSVPLKTPCSPEWKWTDASIFIEKQIRQSFQGRIHALRRSQSTEPPIPPSVEGVNGSACRLICLNYIVMHALSFDSIDLLEKQMESPWIENPTGSGKFEQIEENGEGNPCLNERGQQILSCPHLAFSAEEYNEIKEKMSCLGSGFESLNVTRSLDGKYNICLKEYEDLFSMTCGGRSVVGDASTAALLILLIVSLHRCVQDL